MFKCTECEKIYDIKPDYCDDCGNNTFIEIAEASVEPEKEEVKAETEKKSATIDPEPRTTLENPAEDIKKDKKEIDYFSWSFLLICILISLFIIFFAWNVKEDEIKTAKADNNIKTTAGNIPTSVNGFWNNEPPKAEAKKVVQKPIQHQQIAVQPQTQTQTVKPQTIIPKTPEIKKPVQTTQKQPQTVKKTVQAPVQKPQTSKPAPQPAKTTQKTAQKTTQTVSKPSQQVQPSNQPVWKAIQQPTQPQQPKPQTTQTVKPTQTVDSTALKKELANYKINLRNTIGRKIDFANVIGDGSCTVSFQIASNGKLINRAFSKQSTNTTLNDAVYSAVMATPSYNPPPTGYKNETMYLKITFYNGNFQISLN